MGVSVVKGKALLGCCCPCTVKVVPKANSITEIADFLI